MASLLPRRAGDAFLSFYGPLSLPLLLALWAVGIVLAFGLLHWAAGSALTMTGAEPGFGAGMYLSGTTFFTLGLGDVTPRTPVAKILTVVETGTGFAFLAAVIGYFPVIYQAFSRREMMIALLDARAGSPPTAGELLWRYRWDRDGDALGELFKEWERWAADVLESHLSYAVGDLAKVFNTPPREPAQRLTDAELARLQARLTEGGLRWRDEAGVPRQLAELRSALNSWRCRTCSRDVIRSSGSSGAAAWASCCSLGTWRSTDRCSSPWRWRARV